MSTDNAEAGADLYNSFAQLRQKPLVDYRTNEWRSNPTYASSPSQSSDSDNEPLEVFYEPLDRWVDNILAVIRAPKLRRLSISVTLITLSAVLLWIKVVEPWILEERAARASLSRNTASSPGGLFGADAGPRFPGIVQIADLDPTLLPNSSNRDRRLIFIGDIHGCKKELERLLHKVTFDAQTDHIVALGDIVNKGPDSLGVIDLLRGKKASCVRGNHEDRLLLFAEHAKRTSLSPTRKQHEKDSKRKAETRLAKALSHDQLTYLRSFPLALRVGNVEGMGEVVAVHAGLVPGLPIDSHDPSSIMNMRVIDLKTHVPSKKHHNKNSIPWFKLWNKFQRLLPAHFDLQKSTPSTDKILSRRTTVVYGHDSKRGLQIGKYTKGLDSGCVNGGKLTALVVSDGTQQIVQVDCEGHSTKTKLEDILEGRSTSPAEDAD